MTRLRRGWLDGWKVGTLLLSVFPIFRLSAQCSDGSPPPCQRGPAPPRVTIDSNAVAILPFRVSGPPEAQYLREGMVDLLNVALDGFAGWRVIQPRAFLRQVGAETGPIDVRSAARLARQASAGTFVLGNVVALGPELRVQAELYESVRGTSLASVRARGTVATPAPVADSIASGLARQRLALHGGVTRRALEGYTTTSPVALQEYLVAEQLARRTRWQEAAESLAAAIGHDSTFALAYYGLYRVISWGSSGNALGPGAAVYSIDGVVQSALRHLDRAPPRQRRLLEFTAATDRAESLRLADGLTRDYPDDADAWLERGDVYFHLGLESGESPTISLESLQRAITLDPQVPEAYLHVVQLQSMLGDSAASWRALERLRAIAPSWEATVGLELAMRTWWLRVSPATLQPLRSEIVAFIGRYLLLIGDGAPARAVAIADSFAVLAATPDHAPAERVTALLRRHVYHIAQGRYTSAWELIRQASLLDPSGLEVLAATVLHGVVTGARGTEAADAARQLRASADELPLWANVVLAWHAATTGGTDSARTDVHRLLSAGEYSSFRAALEDGLKGLISIRGGDTAAAHRELARGNTGWIETRNVEKFFPAPAIALEAARLDIRAGDFDAASRRLYQTVGQVGIMFRAEAEELRGQIAERRTDTNAAVRAYRNFIDLWKDADPELQPRVAAAQAALERLRPH